MDSKDPDLIEARSRHIIETICDKTKQWGKIDILFEPGTYDGNEKAIVRPFITVNLVGNPLPSKPVIFKRFQIHDALLVNCCFVNNVMKRVSMEKPSLGHHLRIFNVVLNENTLSNCSIMDYEDFVALRVEREKRGKADMKAIVKFLRSYLYTLRKFASLLPAHRKDIMPEYIQSRFKIFMYICNDGVAIWFRRSIKRKKDSMKVLTKPSIRNVIPKISADKTIFPLDGQKGVALKRLAIVTQGFANSIYKLEGSVFRIPNDFGITSVKSGADMMLEDVMIGYLDRRGKPTQAMLKGLWLIANDVPSLFSVAQGNERAQRSFFRYLLGSAPIRGQKMKRYSEANLKTEIVDVKKEYLSLISRENVEEPELQQFLEKHPFILSPTYLDVCSGNLHVKPQARLSNGKRIVDFLLLFEPDFPEVRRLARVVEIKRPTHKLFTKNGKYSESLKEGLEQLDKVFEILDLEPQEAKKLGLRDSDVISGIVLIGRLADLEKDELSHLQQVNKASNKNKIATFDSLLKNIDTVKDFYGVKGRQPVVVVGQKGTPDEDFTGKTAEAVQRAVDYLKKRRKS